MLSLLFANVIPESFDDAICDWEVGGPGRAIINDFVDAIRLKPGNFSRSQQPREIESRFDQAASGRRSRQRPGLNVRRDSAAAVKNAAGSRAKSGDVRAARL